MKFSLRMLFLEFLALLVILTLVAAGLLAWRLTKGPLDMNVFRPQVEAALTKARGGQRVDVETLALAWSPDKKRIEATIGGITTYTFDNQIHAKAEKGAVWFDTATLIQGKINIVKIRLENGSSALHRDVHGNWTIVSPEIDVFPETEDIQPSKDADIIWDWRKWIPQFREHVETQSFQSVEFSNFNLRLTDSITGLNWETMGAEGIWSADKDGLMLDVSGDLKGIDAPNAVQLRFFSDATIENFSVELGVVGANPARLAAFLTEENYDLIYEGVVDLNIGATANEKDGLLTAQVSAAGENGVMLYKQAPYALDSMSFEALFDVKAREVNLTQLNLKTQKVEGSFSGVADFSSLFSGRKIHKFPFKIAAEDIWVDFQPMFSQPWDINALEVDGVLDMSTLSVVIDRMSGSVPGFAGAGSGRIYLEPELLVEEGDAKKSFGQRIGVEVKATGEGKASPQQIISYWPVNLGSGARDWAKRNIKAGSATKLNFFMDFPPGTNAKPIVPDKALTLDFRVADAEVKFLEDLPPITEASGVGRLRGNSMKINLESGKFGDWLIDEGSVDLPAFHPAGAISEYSATGRGNLKALMEILEGSRLNVCTQYNLACDQMRGEGALEVNIKRPMSEKTTIQDIIFDASGGFVETEIPDLASGFGLVNTDLTLKLINDSLEIKGAGRFGSAPAEFTWKQLFNDDSDTSLIANAVITPDLFNSLGLAARSIMQGEADLELEAFGKGRDFNSIDMHVDLTGAAINLAEIGWLKPLYVPASGEIRYGKGPSGEAVLTGDIEAKGLELAGELTFDDENGLQRANIERIFSENRLDMRGDLNRATNGDVQINVSGPFLDASRWIDGLSDFGKEGPGPGVNILANVSVDKLKLRENIELLNSKIVLDMNPDTLERGLVSGTISRGKGVEATFERDGGDIAFQLRSDDAGYILKTLFKTDYLIGGTLNMNGVFGKEFGTAEMSMKDIRLKGAPILAQVFALASLRGLTDVLNGDGVFFTDVEAPIRINNGQIELPGVKASGPAMGLTTRGWLNLESGELNLDGVVVPSFGVNSALGGIPIIGDLFVSRQGEGVFAVTYSVRGVLERARVSINPLSAVTPGFLRRIMENPSTIPTPEAE